jgi:hypothetical protein
MALRKQDVVRVSKHDDEASLLPRPLLDLYNKAASFLDKQSAVYDHYWAVGIHKAIHKAFPEFAELRARQWSTVKKRAAKRNRINANPQQLALSLASEQSAEAQRSDQGQRPPLHRFNKAVSMEVGQRILLVCAIWSTRNRMTIESGTWGEVAEVCSTIKVKWELPYERNPLWDRFPANEYLDYFEEE